jgi:hypothetical protein
VLDAAHLARMKDGLSELIEVLGDHADVDPPRTGPQHGSAPVAQDDANGTGRQDAITGTLDRDGSATHPAWQAAHPVLCVPGKGPLDQIATQILVQILARHGIASRTVDNDATARSAINDLELGGTAMVWLCTLGVETRLSPLRYTARRLRQRAPSVPVAIAFWPGGEPDELQRRTRQAVGADHYASSLREVVATCLSAAVSDASGEPAA